MRPPQATHTWAGPGNCPPAPGLVLRPGSISPDTSHRFSASLHLLQDINCHKNLANSVCVVNRVLMRLEVNLFGGGGLGAGRFQAPAASAVSTPRRASVGKSCVGGRL